MKTFMLILKILTALAAIAGIIYIAAAYGDKIVAWAKKFLSRNKAHYFDEMEEEFDESLVEDVDFEG